MCCTLHSAPTVRHLVARALSYTEIEVAWAIDSIRSGYLRPLSLLCVDEYGSMNGPLEVDSRSTSIRVENLNPNTVYNCTLTASAYPARGQNLDECTTSANVEPIRTNPARGCRLCLMNLNYTLITFRMSVTFKHDFISCDFVGPRVFLNLFGFVSFLVDINTKYSVKLSAKTTVMYMKLCRFSPSLGLH